MLKGNVNGDLKILTNNMSGGILPLTDQILIGVIRVETS